MGRRAYGLSIAAAMAGCSPPETPRAPGEPSPSLATSATSATPHGATPPASSAPAADADTPFPSHRSFYAKEKLPNGRPAYTAVVHRAAAGKVRLTYTRLASNGPPGACPVASPNPGACGVLTIGDKTAPAPTDWDWVVAGRDRFWAKRAKSPTLDLVSTSGELAEVGGWVGFFPPGSHSRVVETETQTFLVAVAGRRTTVQRLALGATPRTARLTDVAELAIVSGGTAADARDAESANKRVAFGEPAVVALGGERWALAWVHARPPARDVLPRAKDACGRGERRSSRSLADRSVPKTIVVTRFEGHAVVGEDRGLEVDDFDPGESALVAREREGKAVVAVEPRGE